MPWHCECLCLGARAARAPSLQPAGAGAGSGSQPSELTSKLPPKAQERASDLSLKPEPGGDDADIVDEVSLVHHTNTNPPHPVAQPLPPSTEDTPSHCAIIPSFTEHRKPTLQIASMGTKVANVQHVPHCVEPEGLHWLKVPGVMEPQQTQPPPLPPRPPPYVHPSRETHGLQVDGLWSVDDEAVEIHGLQVDDEAVAKTSRPRRGNESAEGADIGGSQPAAKTKPSETEPDVQITKIQWARRPLTATDSLPSPEPPPRIIFSPGGDWTAEEERTCAEKDGSASISTPESIATTWSAQASPLVNQLSPPVVGEMEAPWCSSHITDTKTSCAPADREPSRMMPKWEAEARMYHVAMNHTISFAELYRLTSIQEVSVSGIPPLDPRSADLQCPVCILNKAQSILRNKHRGKAGGTRGLAMASGHMTTKEEAATRLPKFEPKLPSTPPLSPRSQNEELLGFDLSLFSAWSGLANTLTCGLPETQMQVSC